MDSLISNLFIFLLATFLGLEVIRRVSPLLHTPLMSLTNAISAISLVGSLTILGRAENTLSIILGAVAVIASMTNVVSGFLITDRMLRMFKTRAPVKAAAHSFTLPIFLFAALLMDPGSGDTKWLTDLSYLIASGLFVMSLKWMNHPTTARRSVWAGEGGMFLAICGAIIALANDPELLGRSPAYLYIFGALAVGAVIGYPISLVPMTAVPQRTAFSHAFGGLAAGMVGTAEYFLGQPNPDALLQVQKLDTFKTSVIGLEVLLGFITFTGSLIAFGKLAEKLPGRPITYKGQNTVNFVLFAIAIACAIGVVINPSLIILYVVFAVLALVFGVLLVIPIGGADMPTVISLLNSYAGLSACAMGFVLNSPMLIIAGALDGSSGLILSIIMCKAMNRSFTNVLFGAFGQATTARAKGEEKPIRSASPEEAASILGAASSVVIIPGYGMAVAQAQHKVRELFDALTKKGVNVQFAIHPVAGRMPGHMNVLLAEADIPYDKLVEMDDINGEFPQTDVALVIGANDVTNPAARTDPGSPIYGMPILDVDKARTVMVIKRSMSSGFAGIDNELYTMDHTLMLFGDAKAFVGELVKEV
ncbi:MAG TPA: NAD(P)(+) transhydrogenase (Re/Si-specific) subunit beta [Fimbriimonas sp.]|nr:NAD(P)(+) transhydrogenase (Re/Si-specific) subunit beta [Fimbriimonas sp.]